MKNSNTFGVHFLLRKNRVQKGTCPVVARVVVNKTRIELSLKTKLGLEDWNEGKGMAKPKNEHLKKLNSFLEQVRSQLTECYRELSLDKKPINAEMVKQQFLMMGVETTTSTVTEEKPLTLRWLVSEHNTLMKTTLSPGSLKNYFTTERYVSKFLAEHLKVADIKLSDLNLAFLTQFETFVRTVPLKYTDPCNNNGTMKHIERMKKMVNWAYINDWIPKNPFIAYKLRFRTVQREMLSEEELKNLEVLELENKMLCTVRDLFVFSCYTGLAYVDLMGLKPSNLVESADGFTWIKTQREKPNVPVDVPLLDTPYAILEKYRHQKTVPRLTVFPKISNQEINRSLKIIAELCKITKNMSFHLARHTFATTVTLINGVPIESISKMLGHTKLTTTMVYAKVVKQKLSADMSLLKKKLDGSKTKPKHQLHAV